MKTKNQLLFYFNSLLIGWLIFGLAACSYTSSPEIVVPTERNHKVTVFNGDVEQKNPEKQFVQRFGVTQNSLPEEIKELPFRFQLLEDRNGEAIGLKLLSGKGSGKAGSESFGLQTGDIVKTINSARISDMKGMNRLLDELNSTGTASLIFEREGQMYKYYFDLRG